MHVEFENFDLTAVAAEVLRETEMIDQTHQFSARWEESVTINADVGLIKQAMRILVDNSIKYTPAGGKIRLGVEKRDGAARLTVQDEGQGIDAASLPHIFERFYRTDQSPGPPDRRHRPGPGHRQVDRGPPRRLVRGDQPGGHRHPHDRGAPPGSARPADRPRISRKRRKSWPETE